MSIVRGAVGPALATLLALGWPPAAVAQPKELPARVVTLSGRVETSLKGAAWRPAELRGEAGPGDALRTLAGGRLGLRTGSGQAIRLAQLSQLVVPPAEGSDRAVRLRLEAGWLWAAVTPGSPASAWIEVEAGPVTVTARGTGVGLRLNRDGSVLVRVYHGSALCAGTVAERRWERVLRDRQELLVPAAGAPGEARGLTREKPEATWVRWNEEQDHVEYGGPPPVR